MTFPQYPLQLEERIEIVTSPDHVETVRDIQIAFAKRRNIGFPNWQEAYAKEVGKWLAFQKKPPSQKKKPSRA